MAVISLKESRLEKLIDYQASEYCGCDMFKLMAYTDNLQNVNPKNPFIHLAEGMLYARYKPPNRSYPQSLWHLNLFLKAYPDHEHAVWWRLDSATEVISGTPYIKFLSRITKEAIISFPKSIPILNAAYDAYNKGILDTREALKVATRIHYLCPGDGEIRKNIDLLMDTLKDEERVKKSFSVKFRKGPKVFSLRGVGFDNKKC